MSVLNSTKSLKIALAASVALNLFAVAGGVTVWVTKTKAEEKIQAAQTPGRDTSFRQIVGDMDPAVRQRVRATFRASAMAARPDFEQSRDARRQAIELSKAARFDPVAVTALLDQSRAAEIRGRIRMEHDTIALLQTLEPGDRQALSVILSRRGKGGGGGAQGGKGGAPNGSEGQQAAPGARRN